jgi:hypothetical protein
MSQDKAFSLDEEYARCVEPEPRYGGKSTSVICER